MAMKNGHHTIVLVQYTTNFESRSYMDFPSVGDAMDAIVKMYEHKLKELNPTIPSITYDVTDLYNFLDSLHDMCGLIFDPKTNQYAPQDRTWIKDRIFKHLRGQAV